MARGNASRSVRPPVKRLPAPRQPVLILGGFLISPEAHGPMVARLE